MLFPEVRRSAVCFSGTGQAAVATSGAAALDRRISACDGGRYAGCLHPCAVPPKQFFLVNFLERRITGGILPGRQLSDRPSSGAQAAQPVTIGTVWQKHRS